jgi:hypothetical protein
MSMPLSMEPLRPYFDRAHELKGGHPFEAHHVRVFAMTLAMKMNHSDAGNFLLQQMDTLEEEKKVVKPPTKPAVVGTKTVDPPAPAPEAAAPAEAEAPAEASSDAAAPADAEKKPDAPEKKSSGFMDSFKDAFNKKVSTSEQDQAAAANAAAQASAAAKRAAEAKPAAPTTVSVVLEAARPSTPQEALKALAYNLYERARAVDRPATFPSPAVQWSIVEAPRVAMGLHAAAVLLDALKQFSPALPADVQPIQTAAHRRSQQLAGQLQQAMKLAAPCIPTSWAPADLNADVPVPVPAPPKPAPAVPAMAPPSAFPSVPRGR